MMRMILSCMLLLSLFLAACRGSEEDSGDSPVITAGTTIVADLVRNVAGERAEVEQILTANADPHDYEPKPSDAQALASADLVVRSGGDVDEWIDQLIDSSDTEAQVVSLIDSVPVRGGTGGELDPHWWQNPQNTVIAVRRIAEELATVDPEGADVYRDNAADYIAEIRELDRAVAACVETLDPAARKLVTSHDALGYYADRYGLEVIGTVIPARTTQAQTSAGEVAALVDLVSEADVKAIFPEAGVPSDLENAIADEAGAAVGGELWADTLGPEGTSGETYLQALASNTRTIVDGLSGGEEACKDLP